MRIKQHLHDFRVRELIVDGYVGAKGAWRVYRVTKQKCTSLEAASRLAGVLGVAPSDVTMAGLKDRQGVTVQHMAVRGGKPLEMRDERIWVATAGSASGPLEAQQSRGNAFEIVVRALSPRDLAVLRTNVPFVREHGLVNYFDEQRFGNVRHGQGWIARELMRGHHEQALKRLLTAISPHEQPVELEFKTGLEKHWGDWIACREVAGRFGRHHSLFEHLKKNPSDFAGAFYHVPSKLRLIHLFAWQSHVWNRAVCDYLTARIPLTERITLEGVEGPLVHPKRPLVLDASLHGTFPLPGARLEGVVHPDQRACLEDVLARERMVADDFKIEGVPGFQLKGEERALMVVPAHLRVRPAEPDRMNRGEACVRVRFELQRGAYATQVVRRLFSAPDAPAGRIEGGGEGRERGTQRPHAGRRAERGGARGATRQERSRHSGHGAQAQRGRRAERGTGREEHGPQRGPQQVSPSKTRKQRAWRQD
jgi:tRNA pseudouridine13 synthase